MDEKKKMPLLSFVKGKKTAEWKMREQMRLFPENDDPKEKKKAAEETWSSFKQRFWAEWQPIDFKGQAQMKIEEIKMMDRVDDYVNKFHLIAMETKQDHALNRWSPGDPG
uniref:Retrotransposon gag domain-containing protein n=1 Tax=Moniliophthora roreri TaxID=221103 RepID=A0A0W0G241_MONRR